jgi:hypothetical protein
MTWLYNGVEFTEPGDEHYGFVYCITHHPTGRKYIGKKLFWFKKTRQVKGKKKRYLAPSDWPTYYGSSIALKKDLDAGSPEDFTREIIKLCKNKGECTYYEAKTQFDLAVLLNPEHYYNDWIICRVHRKHVL